MSRYMRIGQVAAMTGLSIKAIRYYEAAGVLPSPLRSESRYRLYGIDDVRRFHLIKQIKQLGLSLREIGQLVRLSDEACCTTVRPGLRALLEEKLDQIDDRIQDLQALRASLAEYAARIPAGTVEEVTSCKPDRCLPPVEMPITFVTGGVGAVRLLLERGRVNAKG